MAKLLHVLVCPLFLSLKTIAALKNYTCYSFVELTPGKILLVVHVHKDGCPSLDTRPVSFLCCQHSSFCA